VKLYIYIYILLTFYDITPQKQQVRPSVSSINHSSMDLQLSTDVF